MKNGEILWDPSAWGWWDYIGHDSMMCCIIKKNWGFSNMGLYRISESIRAYVYLFLSSQASVRSFIIGNMVSAPLPRITLRTL